MKDDTIKRRESIAKIKEYANIHAFNSFYKGMLKACEILAQMPSADRPQGEWIATTLYVQGKAPKIAVRCSECKRIPLWLGSPILPTKSGNLLEYCPHCGTRMEGADDAVDAV